MKPNRTQLFIGISSLALLIVLIIQVTWIFETARIKEELFNEKAHMVLSRTTEALGNDNVTCGKIGDRVAQSNGAELPTQLGNAEVQKIDSLFNYYMRLYNIRIDYTFEVNKPNSFATVGQNGVYNYNQQPFTEVLGQNSFELNLIFPDKKQYIIAEMGTLFITSLLLILIVLVLFWRTVRSLLKEKMISEHTTDFLNNMTHEFKTPLTNIALAGKMMVKDTILKQEDKLKHYTSIILEENAKLQLQVEQVLSMTALERGEIPIQKTTLDMHALIQDALKNIDLQIEHREGKVNVHLLADTFVVNGDRSHLTNALGNLLDNAIKYNQKKPDLVIETSNHEGKLRILISDNGIGIDKVYHKKVFDKFFRVPTGDVHDVKGFGLGLAYIKKIMELHQGSIELESETGKGTQFTLTLPHA
jgi:two-component system, OmpR family, phosphate regulon sensor histidine kinase PhoR